MKLYEVNGRIAELMDRLEPDPETGEITGDVDAIIAEIDGLQMERKDILSYLAKLVLNARSDIAVYQHNDHLNYSREKDKRHREAL